MADRAKAKDDFFHRVDRGRTIRAVALGLGHSVQTCHGWRNEAGVSTTRGKSRTYSPED